MEIQSFKKEKDNRYKINFKNKESITLYDDIIIKYQLLITKKIAPEELTKITKENARLECYYQAIKYLGFKSRTEKEIRLYLSKRNYPKEDIEDAIQKLKKENYINATNYIKAYVNDQINLTDNGPKKITRKLLDLGCQEEEIEEYLHTIPEQVWQEKLEKIIKKKSKTNKKDSSNKIKEKILYACLNEGFRKEDILTLLGKVELPKNTEALQKEAMRLYKKLSSKYEGSELYFYLKGKLITKGFSLEDINEVMEDIKKTA